MKSLFFTLEHLFAISFLKSYFIFFITYYFAHLSRFHLTSSRQYSIRSETGRIILFNANIHKKEKHDAILEVGRVDPVAKNLYPCLLPLYPSFFWILELFAFP